MTAPSGRLTRNGSKLRRALCHRRDALHLTQNDVAEAMDWSTSKVVRIENGTAGVSISDLKALLLQYEITDKADVSRLVELARADKDSEWWTPYRELYPEDFLARLKIEASSPRIRHVQNLVVPGLLQTPDYARAIMRVAGTPPEAVERGLEIRMKRQELIADDGPEMIFIIDESVLHRRVGDEEVMRDQLLRIRELASHSNVSIQIMPFSAGAHLGMSEPFVVFELSSHPKDYVLVREGLHEDTLVLEPLNETAEHVKVFCDLERTARLSVETPRIVDELLRR